MASLPAAGPDAGVSSPSASRGWFGWGTSRADEAALARAEAAETRMLRLSRAPRRQWMVRLADGNVINTVKLMAGGAASTVDSGGAGAAAAAAAVAEDGADDEDAAAAVTSASSGDTKKEGTAAAAAVAAAAAGDGGGGAGGADADKVPVVLLHGFLAGVGLWAANLDALAAHRDVYAIDWLGFGRSSRPKHAPPAGPELEDFFLEALESWRVAVGLEKMALVGHSMGAYLSGAYALKYPHRVSKLVLADPWGVPQRPPADDVAPLPWKWRISRALLSNEWVTPLSLLRATNWFGQERGPRMLERFRPDLVGKWDTVLDHAQFEHARPAPGGLEAAAEAAMAAGAGDAVNPAHKPLPIAEYVCAMNSRHPVGETVFQRMTVPIGWASNPLGPRLAEMPDHLPVKMLYGSHTWMDRGIGEAICEAKPKFSFGIVDRAGHHIYVDNIDSFNSQVNDFLNEHHDC